MHFANVARSQHGKQHFGSDWQHWAEQEGSRGELDKKRCVGGWGEEGKYEGKRWLAQLAAIVLWCFCVIVAVFLILHNSSGKVAREGGWWTRQLCTIICMCLCLCTLTPVYTRACVCVCVSLRVCLFAFALSCLISVCFNDAVATLANTCCLTYGHAHTRTLRRGSVLKCKSFLTYNNFAAFWEGQKLQNNTTKQQKTVLTPTRKQIKNAKKTIKTHTHTYADYECVCVSEKNTWINSWIKLVKHRQPRHTHTGTNAHRHTHISMGGWTVSNF